MVTFYMLVGLPGSGKSYQAKLLKDRYGALWLNSDDLRAVFGTSKDDQTVNVPVFEYMRKQTVEALKRGQSVVYDATNLSAKRRSAFLDGLKKIGCRKVCVMVLRRPEECKKAVIGRDHIVPEEVIEKMYRRFETPYYCEGWDEIKVIFTDNDFELFDPDETVNSLMDYKQDCPQHRETLGEHLVGTRSKLLPTGNRELIMAGYLHDIGKPHCRVYGDGTAHYYGHEAVSAYDVMFFYLGTRDKLRISWLISNHMKAHDQNGRSKLRQRCSGEMFEELMMLEKADVSSALSETEEK